MALFKSKLPWKKGRTTDTLVIHCSSGDFRPYFNEFIAEGLKLSEYDVLAVPGGIQMLMLGNFLPKLEFAIKKMVNFLVEKHDLKKIVILGHHDCGWYKDFRFGPVHLDMVQRQHTDLQKVAQALRTSLGLTVEVYYGDVNEKTGDVTFDAVPLE